MGHTVLPSLIIVGTLEDRSHGSCRGYSLDVVCIADLLYQGIDAHVFLVGNNGQSCTLGGKQRAMLGQDHILLVEVHIIDECLAKRGDIGQRAAAEEQGALNLAAMSQCHDCLDSNSTENGSGNVFARNIFGDEVLDIGLAEHTATRSNRINLFGL